ncbi:MAG: hypothetical protein HY436_00450, partial [Candidatus Liptonbacteria bacterium]|nr:hypothetical protein [Candidatus Liptonbacteria bacterium]
KAKSVRRITSKLSAHLEPGNFATVRIVEKNGLQVVDALRGGTFTKDVPCLALLSALLAENEPEPHLWHVLATQGLLWPPVLSALGWDPSAARCERCSAPSPAWFHPDTQRFVCEACLSRLSPHDAGESMIFLGNDEAEA